jgi:hypothetical protein
MIGESNDEAVEGRLQYVCDSRVECFVFEGMLQYGMVWHFTDTPFDCPSTYVLHPALHSHSIRLCYRIRTAVDPPQPHHSTLLSYMQ